MKAKVQFKLIYTGHYTIDTDDCEEATLDDCIEVDIASWEEDPIEFMETATICDPSEFVVTKIEEL